MRRLIATCLGLMVWTTVTHAQAPATRSAAGLTDHPPQLVQLAKEWREWRSTSSAPIDDFAGRVAAQKTGVADFKKRIEALDMTGWSVHAKVDFLVVRSEMDDLDFDLRIVRQVSRNPDFYLTEAARRVSRLIGGRYQNAPGITVPYDAKRADAIIKALSQSPVIAAQAPKCLTEAVPEMAEMAIERLVDVRKNYNEFARVVGQYLPEPQKSQIGPAADAAGAAFEKLGEWLKANRPKFTAPVAVGQPAFEWYLQRVMMIPYNSEQLLMQAEMEKMRNWAFLQFELQRNQRLPALHPPATNAEYSEWKDATDALSRLWTEDHGMFTRPAKLGPMRDEDGGVWIEPFGLMGFPKEPIPAGERREFLVPPDHWFSQIYWEIGHRLDPGTNHPHSDYPGHAFEGAVSQGATCDLRKGHNMRGDAWCYMMEDAQLQMDYPFVRGPRVREWMYKLAIMRAERITVGVKFANGSMTAEEVPAHFMKNAPGMEPYVARRHELWRKFVDPAQVVTYQVGKFEYFKLLMDQMKALGDKFDLRKFNDEFLATGQIAVSLARWEITGADNEVRSLFQPRPIPVSAAPAVKK